jgi:hypothetical protein
VVSENTIVGKCTSVDDSTVTSYDTVSGKDIRILKCARIIDSTYICVGDDAGARGINNDSSNSIKEDTRIGDGVKVSNRTGVDNRTAISIENEVVVGDITTDVVVDSEVINHMIIVGDDKVVLYGGCVVKGSGVGYGIVIGDGTRKIVEGPRIVDMTGIEDCAGVV